MALHRSQEAPESAVGRGRGQAALGKARQCQFYPAMCLSSCTPLTAAAGATAAPRPLTAHCAHPLSTRAAGGVHFGCTAAARQRTRCPGDAAAVGWWQCVGVLAWGIGSMKNLQVVFMLELGDQQDPADAWSADNFGSRLHTWASMRCLSASAVPGAGQRWNRWPWPSASSASANAASCKARE